jgi:hypothetical protein
VPLTEPVLRGSYNVCIVALSVVAVPATTDL